MQVVKRLYLYLVTLISLFCMLNGAARLLALVLGLWLDTPESRWQNQVQESFSLSAALLVVGGLVWVIHWWLAQRSLNPSNPDALQERKSELRALLIYGALFAMLIPIVTSLSNLLGTLFYSLAGGQEPSVSSALSGALPYILIFGLGWYYYWRVRQLDKAACPETSGQSTLRRWYFYLVNYAAFSLLLFQVSELLRNSWKELTIEGFTYFGHYDNFNRSLAFTCGWIIAAGLVWFFHWRLAQRQVLISAEEQKAVLRKVYLYAMILQTVAVTLCSLALFLNNLLRGFFGTSPYYPYYYPYAETLLTVIGTPLLNALVYGVGWAYHTWVLRQDTRLLASEPPRQAGLHRLYNYLVTLVGLVILTVGLVYSVRLLFDFLLKGSFTEVLSRAGWGDEISLVVTVTLAGGPVWLYQWWRLQKGLHSDSGLAERQSLFRRIYLFLVLFMAVITLLFGGASLVYELFKGVTTSFTSGTASNISLALGLIIPPGTWFVYHLRVLLADYRAIPARPSGVTRPGEMATALLLVEYSDPGGLDALRRNLPAGSRVKTFEAAGLTEDEVQGWLAKRSRAPEPAGEERAETPPPALLHT